ncbi:MAG: tRNA epoxyqueuosine(34) reductase QueG [Betaproteobacteria bacterium]|nr:tRNA epoxyqueuosine(34) reductase QueG [Betaproteobacteria bacterium]
MGQLSPQGQRRRFIRHIQGQVVIILGMQNARSIDGIELAARIRQWGRELGFDAIGLTDTRLDAAETELVAWLDAGFHGEMDYMASHGTKRSRPRELVPGTVSVITARMNYLPQATPMETVLADGTRAAISRYALGRDYHKLLRSRLQKLADRIAAEIGAFGYRVFTDSAPVMEVALAEKSGLGWRGKHTLLLTREAGSYFFLGEIYTDLPLTADAPKETPLGGAPQTDHCGTCHACLDSCPTQAIVAPYTVDARRCISYLTIELKGAIPEALRPLIGNRVYGCDDCQVACPWNRYAHLSGEADFAVRNGLDAAGLVELFGWTEAQFKARLAGSAIHRIGFERWLRNLAIGLGNAPSSPATVAALETRRDHPLALVREHVLWALARHRAD